MANNGAVCYTINLDVMYFFWYYHFLQVLTHKVFIHLRFEHIHLAKFKRLTYGEDSFA